MVTLSQGISSVSLTDGVQPAAAIEEVEFPVCCGLACTPLGQPGRHQTGDTLLLGGTLTDREGALTFDRGRRRGETVR